MPPSPRGWRGTKLQRTEAQKTLGSSDQPLNRSQNHGSIKGKVNSGLGGDDLYENSDRSQGDQKPCYSTKSLALWLDDEHATHERRQRISNGVMLVAIGVPRLLDREADDRPNTESDSEHCPEREKTGERGSQSRAEPTGFAEQVGDDPQEQEKFPRTDCQSKRSELRCRGSSKPRLRSISRSIRASPHRESSRLGMVAAVLIKCRENHNREANCGQ